MKLSFSTLACPEWRLASVLDAAEKYGYDGVELRFLEGDDALWARPEFTGAGLAETRSRLVDKNLSISCLDTRSFFHDPDPVVRAGSVEEARWSLDLAARLGAPGVRVFGDRVQPGQELARTQVYITEALDQLGQAAASLGVEVWIETHGDFARSVDTLMLLEKVTSPAVGALWDPSNAFEVGEEPAAGLRVLGSRIRHVHLKDVARVGDLPPGAPWPPKLPGQGDFQPERIFPALRNVGYDRWVSFEWEKKWHASIEEPEIALPYFAAWAAAATRDDAKEHL